MLKAKIVHHCSVVSKHELSNEYIYELKTKNEKRKENSYSS